MLRSAQHDNVLAGHAGALSLPCLGTMSVMLSSVLVTLSAIPVILSAAKDLARETNQLPSGILSVSEESQALGTEILR